MAVSAPRYDSRLIEALRRLDDPSQPIAETVRRVCAVADELGLTRPSYAHLRTYVVEHRRRTEAARARAAAVRKILVDAYSTASAGRHVDPLTLADRLREAARELPD